MTETLIPLYQLGSLPRLAFALFFCWLLCNLLLFTLSTFSFRPCFAHLYVIILYPLTFRNRPRKEDTL